MKRLLLLISMSMLFLLPSQVMAQLTAPFTEGFNGTSIPSGWSNYNSASSTSSNTFWKVTSSSWANYGAQGVTNRPGSSGSYCVGVDASTTNTSGLIVSLETDSINISSLTAPYLEFWYFSDNSQYQLSQNQTLYVDYYDGSSWNDSVFHYKGNNSNWQFAGVDLSTFTTSGKVVVRFNIIKSGSFYNDILVDDIAMKNAPACPFPQGLTASNVQAYSATMHWGAVGAASTYEVIYGATGFDPATAGTSTTNISADSLAVTGLTPASDYDFYVIANCGTNGTSDTAGPGTFTTTCAPIPTPYTQNFDNTPTGGSTNPSAPNCWAWWESGGAGYGYTYGFISRSASNSFRFYNSSTYTTGDTNMLISPHIIGLDSGLKQITFYGYAGTAGAKLKVGTVSDQMGNDYNEIITLDMPTTSTWYEFIIPIDSTSLSGNSHNYIAIVHGNTANYQSIYVDDVLIENIPPCPKPVGFSASNITSNSAVVSWLSNGSSFNVEVGPQGFSQGTGSYFYPNQSTDTLTGLFPNTWYDVYIQNDCQSSGNGSSIWSGPFSFKTLCVALQTPFSENFDGTSSGTSTNPSAPDCWFFNRTQNGGTGYGYTQNSSFYANSGTNLFYMYSSSNMTNDTMALISPEVAGMDTADKHIEFWATGRYSSTSYTEEIAIATMSNPLDMTTLNFIDTVDITGANSYQYFDIYLDAANGYNGTDTYIALVALGNYYFQIDDITISDIPQCVPSNNLSVSNITNNSADVSWTAGDGLSYRLEYGPTGFVQGTGPVITGLTSTSYSLSSLTGNTCYDVYVGDSCAIGLSPWFGPFTFCTTCDPQTTPLTVDFEGIGSGSSINPNEPACWTFSRTQNGGTGYGYTYNSTTYANSGTASFYLYSSTNMTSDTMAFISPSISGITTNPKMIDFWARKRYTGTSYTEQIVVGTVASPTELNTFVAMDTITLDVNYTQYSYNIVSANGYNGTHTHIALVMLGNYYTHLDDISIDDVPTCAVPWSLNASNITATTADANWTTLYGTNFKVEYGPTGFIQGTGNGMILNNTTSGGTMTGLTPNTYYDFYVADKCDSNSWAGPLTFKSACLTTLNGTYTVGGTPGANNFVDLDSALTVLNGCGVSGPVTLNLQGGTHTGPLVLNDITGVSATNTVTINGMGMNMDTIYALGQTAGCEVNGASYVTISNVTIDNSMGSRGAWLYNNAHHITFEDCRIMASTTSSSSVDGGVVVSGSSTTSYDYSAGVDNLTLDGCEISGGYFGIIVNGASTTSKASDITVEDCHIMDAYYYGMRLYYVEGAVVKGNVFDNFRNTTNYGMYMYYNDDFQVEGNMVDANYMGLYCYYSNYTSTPTTNSTIINNMLASSGTYGLYLGNLYYADVFHNSVNTQNTYGCYGTGIWSNVDFRNNILVGGTYALYKSSLTSDVSVDLDYNSYHSNGSNLAYWSGVQASLSAWQTAYSSLNANSLSGDPVFVSATDLHIVGTLVNDEGDNTAGVLEDIDGDTRPASGSTSVDIGADEFTPKNYDVTPVAITSPTNMECGDTVMDVKIAFVNLGLMSTNTVSVTVNITGATTAQMTGSYTGSVSSLNGDTITVSSFNSSAGGTYNIEAILSMTGDQDASNDTLYTTVSINDVLARDPMATADTVCAGDYVTLYFPPNTSGMNFEWQTATGDSIATADSLMVGPMGSNDTTFLLHPVSSSSNVGPVDNTIGGGGNYTAMNHYLEFTVNTATTIYSVDVLTNGTGNVDVLIQNAGGTTLFTHTVAVTTAGWNTLVINQPLPAGSYRMGGTTTNNAGGLYRNSSGASFPYTSADGNVSITGNTFSATYYYFFYNWVVGSGGCPRPDGEITIYNGGALNAAFTSNLNPPTTIDLTVNFDASGSVGANTYTWDFGDGNVGSGMNVSHNYTSNGQYTVTLVVDGVCGSDTLTQMVTIAGIGIEESLIAQTLNIYPNPNDGQFRVEFQMEGLKDVKVRIVDAIGKEIYFNEPGKVSGMYKENIDISENADGLYIIQIITDEATISRKITLQ